MQSALDALGESVSAVAKGLTPALHQAQRGAQVRPLAAQFEECQAFIKRSQNRLSRLEEERVAEQEALDAGLARLARIRQEMTRATESAIPVTIPNGAEDPAVVINQLRGRVAEMEAECEGLLKKRTRSLSVPCQGWTRACPCGSRSPIAGPLSCRLSSTREVLLSRSQIVSARCEDSPQQDREVVQVSWCSDMGTGA